jgi:hypothetical protein
MKHHAPTSGVSAADIERALDRLALAIKAQREGRKLLPLYARLEEELAAIKSADDVMAKVMARLERQG